MNPDDMDAPVTRRELREELQQLEERLEQKLDQKLDQKLEKLRVQLGDELKAHANAIHESTRAQLAAIDEKYSAIPARVTKLEECCEDLKPRIATLERKVFAPRKRRKSVPRAIRRRG
jgi:chaperonin cofactor prefoldin